jgi:hypothetical protein
MQIQEVASKFLSTATGLIVQSLYTVPPDMLYPLDPVLGIIPRYFPLMLSHGLVAAVE